MDMKTSLLDLPNELLLEIAHYLEESSLLSLGMMCKRLNRIMIPVLFRIFGFDLENVPVPRENNLNTRILKLTAQNMLLLPAIKLFSIGHRGSKYLDYVDTLECIFSSSTQVLRDTRTLNSLITQLPYIGRIKLNLSAIRFHDLNHSHTPEPGRGVRAIEWSIEFAQVMNTVLEREETVLEVVGVNDYLTKVFQGYAKRKKKKEEREAERRREEERRLEMEAEMLKKKRNHAGTRLSALRKTIFPALRKRSISPIISQEAVNTISDPQFIDDVLPPPVKQNIRTFNIHSPILLQYPFLTWTSQLTSASNSPLQIISVANVGPLTSFFLDEFRIPSLREFCLDVEDLEIPSIPAPTKVFQFLTRHPNISRLDMSRLSWKSPPFSVRQSSTSSGAGPSSDFLPNLEALVATPEYAAWFFGLAVSTADDDLVTQPGFPKLASLTIASDFYGMPPYGYQYSRFERVLRSLAGGSWIGLSLELRFLCRLGLIEWLESSFLLDDNLIETTSRNITTLALTTSARFYFSSSILRALATWIARAPVFRGLQEIVFGEKCVFDEDHGVDTSTQDSTGGGPKGKLTCDEKRAVSREWVFEVLKDGCPKLTRVGFGSDIHEHCQVG